VRVVVLDNLREGVLTPTIYDPTVNPLYRDVLNVNGMTPLASILLKRHHGITSGL